jgi:DNA-directed RNA polymerase beta' subunit
MSQKNLESVIYYASYLVVGIDEEKKKKALEDLLVSIEKRKLDQKAEMEGEEKKIDKEAQEKKKDAKEVKVKGEQKNLIAEELELQKRQKVARLE